VTDDEIQSRIYEFLQDELRIDTSALRPDTELVSTGVMDSTDIVRLATFLERSFGIEVPDQDVNAERLETVSMSAEYVRDKLPG
jgi:acyl carrier protein